MANKTKSLLGRELSYILMAPFFVLIGIIIYGILFDKWYRDPKLILEYSAIAYGAIMVIRLFRWAIKSLSN